jgi:hypothetical protein
MGVVSHVGMLAVLCELWIVSHVGMLAPKLLVHGTLSPSLTDKEAYK